MNAALGLKLQSRTQELSSLQDRAPLKVNNHVFGVLRVDHDSDGFFDAERSRLLSAVALHTDNRTEAVLIALKNRLVSLE